MSTKIIAIEIIQVQIHDEIFCYLALIAMLSEQSDQSGTASVSVCACAWG